MDHSNRCPRTLLRQEPEFIHHRPVDHLRHHFTERHFRLQFVRPDESVSDRPAIFAQSTRSSATTCPQPAQKVVALPLPAFRSFRNFLRLWCRRTNLVCFRWIDFATSVGAIAKSVKRSSACDQINCPSFPFCRTRNAWTCLKCESLLKLTMSPHLIKYYCSKSYKSKYLLVSLIALFVNSQNVCLFTVIDPFLSFFFSFDLFLAIFRDWSITWNQG